MGRKAWSNLMNQPKNGYMDFIVNSHTKDEDTESRPQILRYSSQAVNLLIKYIYITLLYGGYLSNAFYLKRMFTFLTSKLEVGAVEHQ